MKKIYIEPKAVLFNLNVENPLCTATLVGAQIKSDQYDDVIKKPIDDGPSPSPDWEPAITAKNYDNLWTEDDDE